jgi:hypothetical protein
MENRVVKIYQYYVTLNRKDIVALEKMFSETSIYYDWNIILTGKENILNHYKQYFADVSDIVCHIDDWSMNENNAFVKLSLMFDNKQINVVDIITFDELDLIVRIQSYRQ